MEEPFNKEIVDKLMPVDVYVGGKEHGEAQQIRNKVIFPSYIEIPRKKIKG